MFHGSHHASKTTNALNEIFSASAKHDRNGSRGGILGFSTPFIYAATKSCPGKFTVLKSNYHHMHPPLWESSSCSTLKKRKFPSQFDVSRGIQQHLHAVKSHGPLCHQIDDQDVNRKLLHEKGILTKNKHDVTSDYQINNSTNNIYNNNNNNNDINEQHETQFQSHFKSKNQRPRIPILSYKNQYVILSKPPGMTMHHNTNSRWNRSKSPVLQTTIRKQLSRKPYLVHRLDHRTSGAVLMAFSSEAAAAMHGRLRGEGAVKGYVALVRGDLREEFQKRASDAGISDEDVDGNASIVSERRRLFGREGTELIEKEYYGKITVDLPIKIDGVEKEAQTDFYFLASMDYDNNDEDNSSTCEDVNDGNVSYATKSLTLLLCRPHTGRTHQIRRHVQKALQSPIIGDSEHGDSRVNRFWREKIGLDRLGLHCWYLDLPEESSVETETLTSKEAELGERIQCIAPLPPDLSLALQSEELRSLWEEAIRVEPRLTMEPYDERGGTYGRNFRKRRDNYSHGAEIGAPSTIANTDSKPTAKWIGSSMSQDDMMERDTLLIVSDDDLVIGSESKRVGHEFTPLQPRGLLHRAFSVFLFDESTNELLLQKRASTKITFPNVWTNTCCSHPLHGMDVNEVDGPESVRDGSVMGAKAGAVRKLEHELGIPLGELKLEQFKFLTRVHYWAADTITHGVQSPWGEHEIDYILFATVPSKDAITLNPHPDEVDDYRWVSQAELLEMFADKSLLFSPWFRIIANRWMIGTDMKDGVGWWDDLNRTMKTNDFCDYEMIHRFDPPTEHLGGGGDAGPIFTET